MNPAPRLWSNANLFAKDPGQPALTNPHRARTPGDVQLFPSEQIHRLIDHLRSADTFTQQRYQRLLQSSKLLRRTRSLAKTIDKPRFAPDAIERDGLFKEKIGTLAKEPRKSAGPNNDSRQLGHVGSIDHLVSGARPNNDCPSQLDCLSYRHLRSQPASRQTDSGRSACTHSAKPARDRAPPAALCNTRASAPTEKAPRSAFFRDKA